ncbi:MAG: S8 family serine peptidase, partial [Micromonosporaceae bacterium]|nr:S8 family serine peptidase [Micromonosporaceae bacterium]
MRRPKWLRAGFAVALLPPLIVLVSASPGEAQPVPRFTAEPLAPPTRVSAQKAPTSRLARTDASLLGRTDSTPIPVMVKLDYDSVATYSGGVAGYPATSPAVTGHRLTGSAAERRYESYLAERENAFVKQVASKIPGASVRTRLRTVYGGVSAIVPANKIGELLKVPGVAAVQKDELRKKLTDASPQFIGATALYPQLGGDRNAGKGVIIGDIDTGAWPEHPSFADQGNLAPPPPKADGTPRECDFGDNPLTPQTDVFHCNNKLIGGAAFLDTYNAVVGGEKYTTARDSDGHGTHTASTAAGNFVSSAEVFGVDRGPIHGIAPGAWISVYKALGAQGGFSSDLAAAAQQAIKDGVNVINYSISGGSNPFTDPVELAFLDAYAAGVFVSASAGNSGPGAATTDHVSPWVTTVAASTQTREFTSTLTLTSGSDTLTLTGASITAGVSDPTPVVMAQDVPGYTGGSLCQEPASPGLFAGKIVACERGVNARVEKGYNVVQGGAAGMILYNPSLADVETDNHWLPAVHLADGTQFLAFMAGHTGVTATFTAGQKTSGKGDVMAAFSSRGPGGLGIKPDITAPGVQILAGNTPTPAAIEAGPPGELYQAIAGTSMSAPHITGSAALLKSLHPDWTPGQIKSALMTTAKTGVVKEDETTPADPFDFGSGRVDLTKAGNPGLTFDETAERMFALGNDPVNAIHLNLPSVNAPVMPGKVTTVRTAKNVTKHTQTYRVQVTSPAKSKITVSPSRFTVRPGKSVELRITITSTASGQQFGQIRLDPAAAGLPTLHLPVAFVPKQGDVTLTSSCTPDTVRWLGASTCTVTAQNQSFGDTTATLKTETDLHLLVTGADGAKVTSPFSVEKKNVPLSAAQPGVPSVAPGSLAGFLPLAAFGVAPEAVGDEEILNFDVPEFVYNGVKYTRVGVDSNGYLIVGGGTSEDNECCNLPDQVPDPARPNNILAPFWTDLDGTGAPGILATVLTDGTNDWLVFEWQVNVWGTTSNRHFQVWIGLNGEQDITFAYDPAALPADPNGQPFLVGAENQVGEGGGLPPGTLPTEDLRVTSTDPVAGGTASYTV